MSKPHDPEDPVEMDKWIREFYRIEDEPTDTFLIRTGVTANTPAGFVKRMNMALAWLWPQLTPRTRPMYDEIRTIVEDYHRKTTRTRPYEVGKPLDMAQEPTEVDEAKCEKAMLLFEQIKQLHRVETTLAAQEAFKQAQSARASKPRKKNEDDYRRIAKAYWDSKASGSGYGIAKALASEHNISTTTIHAIANKYKPLN